MAQRARAKSPAEAGLERMELARRARLRQIKAMTPGERLALGVRLSQFAVRNRGAARR